MAGKPLNGHDVGRTTVTSICDDGESVNSGSASMFCSFDCVGGDDADED